MFTYDSILSSHMRAIEDNCEWLGISKLILMENAGKSIFNEVSRRFKSLKGLGVLIVCGIGNNGGDGFVAARHLSASGANVTVVLVGSGKDIRTHEARTNFNILRNMEHTVRILEVKSINDLSKVEEFFAGAQVIIDAIFGTGLKGEVREPYRSAINLINSSKAVKIAVDVPSGLNPDTGEVHGVCVKADVTVTFHRVKRGLTLNREYAGEIVVANIGIPLEAELFVGPGDLKSIYRPRSPYSKKGDNGRILVVGGSEDYAGAPALVALASLRAGADLAIVAAPVSVANVIRSYSPNLIVRELCDKNLCPADISYVLNLAEKCDVMVIGPGLGLREETVVAVSEIIKRSRKPMVIDADALKVLSQDLNMVKGKSAVLTPHAGEFAKLTGVTLGPEYRERMEPVRSLAQELNVVVLLKGHYDVISDGRRIKVNRTGTSAMTVGGTGDVLSGLTATLIAQTGDLFGSACVAAFINGIAGELAEERYGARILATDVIDMIPYAFKKILEG